MSSTHLLLEHAAVQRQIRRGLVAYWPLASGGAVDLKNYWSGNTALTLVNNASVTRAAGPSNTLPDAASFASGSSQYLSHAAADIDFTRSFTVTCWINGSSFATNDRLILGKDVLNDREFSLNVSTATSRLAAQGFDGGANLILTAGPVQVLSTGTWYFAAARYNADTRTLTASLNAATSGNSYATATGATPIGSSNAEFQIGARVFTTARGFWDGQIAAITFHRRVLSQAEIAWLYNSGAGRNFLRVL